MKAVLRTLSLATILHVTGASAALIQNGGFDSGDLSGFTVSDLNGNAGESLGYPNVTAFNVVAGQSSNAATFNVGTATVGSFGAPGTLGGAAVSQTIATSAGLLSLSFNLASFDPGAPNTSTNRDGGTYSLLLDGVSLSAFSVGAIASGTTVRDTLSGSAPVTAGQHTVGIAIERTFVNDSGSPLEYIDNVAATLTVTSVAEPCSIILLMTGLLGTATALRGAWRRRGAPEQASA